MKKIGLFLVFLSLFLLTSCYPVTRTAGEVVDAQGKPLENVSLKLTGKSLDTKQNSEYLTKADGRFNFDEINAYSELPIELKLTASKAGYKTVTTDLKFGEDNVKKITLEAETK
jgi:hypothetical protein